jgi:dTDP-4-amino-4,6-dideoxygalactose transaminase
MPVMLREPERRSVVRQVLREQHGIQTSVLYPAIHQFSAYRDRPRDGALTLTELAARSELTIPLYPQMTEHQQDRVMDALEAALTE